MTNGGIFMFAASWTLIIGISYFCMSRVIKLQDSQAEHIKPIIGMDTGDLSEELQEFWLAERKKEEEERKKREREEGSGPDGG